MVTTTGDEGAILSEARQADDKTDDERRRRGRQPAARSEDLCGRKDSKIRAKLQEIWNEVRRGFEEQAERADRQMDYWDAYNCRLGPNQFYESDAEIFIPIIHDAIEARATRFTNQLFPQGGQYVDAVSTDGSVNGPIVDILHEYIDASIFDVDIIEPLFVTGDVEGHYNVYVDWFEVGREIVSREIGPPTLDGMPIPGEEIEDAVSEEIVEGRPIAEVLHDCDVLVLPVSADSVEEALQAGGRVAIVRRWSKAKLTKLADAGIIRRDAAKELEDMMSGSSGKGAGIPPDTEKLLAEIAGIRKRGGEATVWEVWSCLPLSEDGRYDHDGDRFRLCQMFFGPDQLVLGCRRNPNWNDRCNLISHPVKKVPGVFKGKSPCEAVISLQYEANDAANEGADAAHYAAMPVVFRDPASGNEPIILNIGAIIDVPPNAVKFAEFPDLTPRAIQRIQYCIAQIFQSLGVNPSMLPQQTSTSRRNQAQIAQEQQIDLLTVARATQAMQRGVLTPAMAFWVDLDYQYRDRDLTVRSHGAFGVRANMQPIPPFKTREYYRFRWWGADAARNAVQAQPQVAWLNVANSLGPALAQQGKMIDFTSALEASAGPIFGPRLAGLIIKDMRAQFSIDPNVENEMLAQGDEVPISIFDDDPKHIQSHQQAAQMSGDPTGAIGRHNRKHQMAMVAKQQAMMAQAGQQALGPQGGQSSGRGGQGPRPGGQPGGTRPSRGPPGMMHPDQIPRAGGIMLPRKF